MSTTFYIKKGRRYFPVNEYDSELLDSFPEGAHLVMVKPGSTSRRYKINPDFAPMIAAGRYAMHDLASSIVGATSAKPTTKLNPEQQAAWEAFKATLNGEVINISYASAWEAATQVIANLEEAAAKLLENPAVKVSYDNFQLLSKLTMEHNK